MVETSKQDRMPYLLFLCENRISCVKTAFLHRISMVMSLILVD